MPQVKFTKNLQRFFPNIETVQAKGDSVREVIDALEQLFPGLAAYVVDDQGALREHVHIFINQDLIHDTRTLSDSVQEDDQVFILQALSGG